MRNLWKLCSVTERVIRKQLRPVFQAYSARHENPIRETQCRKKCPDIVYTGSGGNPLPPEPPNPETQEIPVFLIVDGNTFSWEVRLPPVPEGFSDSYGEWKPNDLFQITFQTVPEQAYRFRFPVRDGARFRIGTNPPEKLSYKIYRKINADYRPVVLAPKCWRVNLDRGGVVHMYRGNLKWAAFSSDSGRLLGEYADIGVNENIYVVTRDQSLLEWQLQEVLKTEITSASDWHLYRCRATNLTLASAKWFGRIHLNLLGEPTRFTPVWPPSVSCPNLRMHRNGNMVYYLQGIQSDVHVWSPKQSSAPSSSGNTSLKTTTALIQVDTSKTLCTLVADRSGTLLQSEYLWRPDPFRLKCHDREFVVTNDQTGETITAPKTLEPGRYRIPRVEFSGFLLLCRPGKEQKKTPFNSEDENLIVTLAEGDTLSLFYALDCEWEVTCERAEQPPPPPPEPQPPEPPQPLLPPFSSRYTVRIPFSHSMGCLAKRLSPKRRHKWRTEIHNSILRGWMWAATFEQLKRELDTP